MKKVVLAVLGLFIVWALIQRPNELATVTGDAASWTWGMTQTLFSSTFDFLGALFD